MSQLTEWKASLCRWLAAGEGLEQVAITPEFPTAHKPLPLERPRISVGLDSLSAGEEGWEEFQQGRMVTVRPVETVLRLELITPASQEGGLCHQLWECLCHRLIFTPGEFSVEKLWCQSIGYDREAGGYRLTAKAALTLPLVQPAGEARYRAVDVQLR